MLPGPLLVSLLLSLHGPAAVETAIAQAPAPAKSQADRPAAGDVQGQETRKGEPARGGAPKAPVCPPAQDPGAEGVPGRAALLGAAGRRRARG